MAMQRYQVDICAIWKIQHDWSIGSDARSHHRAALPMVS